MFDLENVFNDESIDGICAVIRCNQSYDLSEEGNDEYFCHPIFDVALERVTYWLCVKKSALPKKGRVTFKVPENTIGGVIGYGGRNIQFVSKELKLPIKVVAD